MADNIQKEMLKTISILMTTAFAFVAGSAWNEAIQALLNEFLEQGSALIGMLIYAVVVTIIAVIVTLFIGRLMGKVGIDIEDE
ncbi:DUF5654 family protein [Candidatus Methanosphaera massiliense]|uniref:DUF5654 family protein n=1 Tax=Candidatus Methanosphaera massiliense TaxID=3017187 RepID=UPI0023805FF9|nr:DUF5654 family protein [Candidatus Methanosphaera massiliense]MDE4078995.1 DUF5654 family protein [Candidatus Methanosphaera massiliense]